MAGYRSHFDANQPQDALGQKGKRVRIRCDRPSTFSRGMTAADLRDLATSQKPAPYRIQDTCPSCSGWTYTYLPSGQKKPCKPCNQTGLNQRKGA